MRGKHIVLSEPQRQLLVAIVTTKLAELKDTKRTRGIQDNLIDILGRLETAGKKE